MLFRLTFSFLIFFFSAFSYGVNEEFKVVDPSDLTRVYTTASLWFDSNTNIKGQASFSGKFAQNNEFMGLLEGTFGDDLDNEFGTDYRQLRAQYFQAFKTGWYGLPKLGVSLDYMHFRGGDRIVSVGGVVMINPKVTKGFMVFPNIAYTEGEIGGVLVQGISANLFISKKLSSKGVFLQFWPEYINVSGDSFDGDSLNWNLLVGSPVSEKKDWWILTKAVHGKLSFENGIVSNSTVNSTTVMLALKKFF